jgi:hypothetical protein
MLNLFQHLRCEILKQVQDDRSFLLNNCYIKEKMTFMLNQLNNVNTEI